MASLAWSAATAVVFVVALARRPQPMAIMNAVWPITALWAWATTAIGDSVLAYVFGIAFQYFAIAPMRGIQGLAGIRAAIAADTLSLTAFEIGLFAWMWAVSVLFHPALTPAHPAYWLSMQIGMGIGFLTAFPMNRRLIAAGIKEAM